MSASEAVSVSSQSATLRSAVVFLAAVVIVTVFNACGGDDGDSSSGVSGEMTVFAASSLTDAFREVGTAFEAKYPGTTVSFNFAASSALAVQINEGAPADVYASADTNQMKNVSDNGHVEEPVAFARNTPVVVVPKHDSPVADFADLAKPGVRLVLAASEVPIGRYARQILMNASGTAGVSSDFSDQVLANLKSNEANVRAVLTKVQLGEADAGIVYKTDVGAAAGDISTVEIPEQYNVVATYPLAVVKDAKNHEGAVAFVDFVRSDEGQAILAKYGFVRP